jgi:1-acyl-sn-glycerol-3-phosphate acyltransferase
MIVIQAFMANVRAFIKLLFWIPIVVGYLSTCALWKIFVSDPVKQRRLFAKTVSWYSRRIIWFMNAKVKVKNMPPEHHPFLLVGNHLGFFDIILLASVRPCLFITSVEMKETPLLGTMCEMGGCVFVERRRRANIAKEIEVIRQALKQDFNVVLYPEGTSNNGEQVWPFKKSLMTAAAGTGVPILPMVINFTRVNGQPMTWKWRDYVFWYGEQTFFPALWRMMSLKSVKAEIEFLEPIICHDEEERRHIAQTAHDQISKKFKKIPLGPGEV